MTKLKIASWNVNGIRARINTLETWLKVAQPDILCLQETKIIDELFPEQTFADLGYHVSKHGQKSFNGVAILSRQSPIDLQVSLPNNPEDPQARYIEALFDINQQMVRVASLYCPNGNPTGTEKYSYKLDWMQKLTSHIQELLTYEEISIFIGDYNIIPQAIDAAKPEKWLEDALFLPAPRAIYQNLLNLGLTDAIRACSDEPNYSFWDYQARAFERNDGIRIDHALLSPEAASKLETAYIEKEVRAMDKPSDHVPIIVELNL